MLWATTTFIREAPGGIEVMDTDHPDDNEKLTVNAETASVVEKARSLEKKFNELATQKAVTEKKAEVVKNSTIESKKTPAENSSYKQNGKN